MLCAAAVAADKRDCLDYSLPSKDAINASLLFDEAHRYIGEGRYGTARVALEALAAVYPESCLAPQARETIQTIEQRDREDTRLVRAVRFSGLRRVSTEEALERFDEREVALAADRRFEPQSVDQAKLVLRDLLAEKGLPHARVTASTKTIAPQQVEVTFHVTHSRWLTGMLRLP